MNDKKWDLTPIYESLDSESFKMDIEKLANVISSLQVWAENELKNTENSAEKIKFFIKQRNIIDDLSQKLSVYTQLSLNENSENETALKYAEKTEKIISDTSIPYTAFEKWFSGLENKEEIYKDTELSKYRFFLEEIDKKSRYLQSEKEEEIISKMKATGSSSWEKLWEKLITSLMPEVGTDKKRYPFSDVRNMAYSPSQQLRKAAYEAEIKCLDTIKIPSAAALNGIKGEVLNICNIRGYSSPLEMTLIDSRLDKEIFDNLISSVKNLVPCFKKYFERKAKLLGCKKLKFYDLFAPLGKNNKTYSYDDAQKIIIEVFSSFSPKMGNFAKNAFDNNWIDVYPRQYKTGGAFCECIHSIKQSRILTNFTGSFSDVVTIAHELGHSFHDSLLYNSPAINSDYPMPVAETASTFAECLIKNAVMKKSEKEEALSILENDISDSAQVICDIYSRFMFEKKVFEKRTDGPLSPDEFSKIMLESQKEAYCDSLDEEFLHKYMWIVKPHYYDADYNYYNFPYAFGLIFAKELYSIYEKKGAEFAEDYEKIFKATGSNSIKDVALIAGIDMTKKDWSSAEEIIKKDIDKFLEMTK
ncbi:MAG: M3 family oligoendopeptidase [Clostridia bacterium]|jgi:pepF/M3 family oligoendopeptidase|nr:M3 family oligoendopeptidase [Clostridia bacterium]